jgi:molecular chaperone DnaK (HSP70)
VDLGTTFSVVGFNKDGKVIIVEDKAGHKIFPSIVSYLDNGGKRKSVVWCISTQNTNIRAAFLRQRSRLGTMHYPI